MPEDKTGLLVKWAARIEKLKYTRTFQHKQIQREIDIKIKAIRQCAKDYRKAMLEGE